MQKSCSTDILSPEERQLYEEGKQKLNAENLEAEKLGLTAERLQEIKEYTAALKAIFPHFKPDRLQRKVAQHFKIKLV